MDREKVIKGIQECDLNGGLIGNCPFKGILALLKEQEAVEPTWKQGKAYCGSCGKRIPLKIGARYCHKCGQKVKWG